MGRGLKYTFFPKKTYKWPTGIFTLLIIREIQIKITMRYHLKFVKVSTI